MKKRNWVLEILICAAVVAAGTGMHMSGAKEDAGFRIVDAAGDRSHLADFSFEGIAADSRESWLYRWQEGQLETAHLPCNWDTRKMILDEEERDGGIWEKYFSDVHLSSVAFDFDFESIPGADAVAEKIETVEAFPEELRTEVEAELGSQKDAKLEAVKADRIKVYCSLRGYGGGGSVRFDTGLELAEGPYYYVKIKNDTVSTEFSDPAGNLGGSAAEMADAYYFITETPQGYVGEIPLIRIPKAEMSASHSMTIEQAEALYTDSTFGKIQRIAMIPVEKTDRIIGMVKAGEERLLLAVTKNDVLWLQLYDTKGQRLTELETGLTDCGQYDLESVRQVQRDKELVLSFEVLKKRIESEDGTEFHYDHVADLGFWIAEDTIYPLQLDGYCEYLDVQNGKVLEMTGIGPSEHLSTTFWGYTHIGYDIRITELASGAELYSGTLMTDFHEDRDRLLTLLNLGEKELPLQEREGELVEWEERYRVERGCRAIGELYPTDAWLRTRSWTEGMDWEEVVKEYHRDGGDAV